MKSQTKARFGLIFRKEDWMKKQNVFPLMKIRKNSSLKKSSAVRDVHDRAVGPVFLWSR